MSGYNDPTDLRGQERERAEKALREKAAQEAEDSDWVWIMSTKRGRRIIWRQLEQAGVFRLSFNTNALMMAFNEGNRSFGNKALAKIHELCPDQFPLMQKENSNVSRDGHGNGDNSN